MKETLKALKVTGFIFLAFGWVMWGGMIWGGLFFLGGKEHDKVIWFIYSAPLFVFVTVLFGKRMSDYMLSL